MFFFIASPLISLTALLLMVLQCTRRFVETNFLQIFSKSSKINLSHYLVGYLHYYGVILVIVSRAAGFVRYSEGIFRILSKNVILHYVYFIGPTSINFNFPELLLSATTTVFFLFAWYKQYESNMIFINLRKNSCGS